MDNQQLKDKVNEWLLWDKNPVTSNEIDNLWTNGENERLERSLMKRMTFGTAGLRGRMAAGYACMNDLVIIQTAQGLLKYLENTCKDALKLNGIVLGYDARHNSRRFAELTAAIFLNAEYPVHLFGDYVPTPFVPFAVTKWKCVAGVMVTASHNPKEDNGYKVYGANGSQIVSPADKNIQNFILGNLEPLESSWDTSIVYEHPLYTNPLNETKELYYKIITNNLPKCCNLSDIPKNVKFVYTAMHGVGYEYVKDVLSLGGIEIVPVLEQIKPDPEFPTVKFPNPEEGKSSLDLSFRTATENDCNIILANDPDADRLAVAEKLSSGDWKVFNGNEIGALLGWWQLHNYKYDNNTSDLSNIYMLSSTVSSKILKSMSKKEGFNFIETLTGFKWMGNVSYELLKENNEVLFAFEEAIGFMCGSAVLDKDGVSAAVQLATLAIYLYQSGSSLNQQLEDIYIEYGQHISLNSYFICHDEAIIKKIFERIRNFNGNDTYPNDILNGKYKICNIRDLTTGYDSSQIDKVAILPSSKSSQMITFEFDNGLVATLRTSGTEPKIKYYTELCASNDKNKDECKIILNEMVHAIIEELLCPQENKLIPKED